jgi:hypothetical protein
LIRIREFALVISNQWKPSTSSLIRVLHTSSHFSKSQIPQLYHLIISGILETAVPATITLEYTIGSYEFIIQEEFTFL